LWGLVWREIKARYRYAVLGFLWAIIEPITLMLLLLFVFTFVFKQRILLQNSGEIPMATQILCGLIFWQYFAMSVSSALYP
jgi:ABC-type polysaccharide/polyol phosphate export permease